MAKRQVFYSFHFDNDVMRVQQVRNMGVIEGNPSVSPNTWEEIKRSEAGIKQWINYEIEQAWAKGMGVVGIHIHHLNCPNNTSNKKGSNPFNGYTINNGTIKLTDILRCYEPSSWNAYNDIKNNIEQLIEEAIKIRNQY